MAAAHGPFDIRAFTTKLDDVLSAASQGDGAPSSADTSKTPGEKNIVGQQGVIWFSNIYPTKVNRWDFRQFFTHHNHETLIPELMPEGVEVRWMVPREREGGAFAYFKAPPHFVLEVLRNLARQEAGTKQMRPSKETRYVRKGKEDVLGKVCEGISQYLKRTPVHARLCPYPVRAHRVEGEPFLEDLRDRYPSSRLKISFEPSGPFVHEEQVYTRLRRYGELVDIEPHPDGSQSFRVRFRYAAGAIAARNCLHRARVDPASVEETPRRLIVQFEPFTQKWLRDALKNNARYAIPVLVLLSLSATYLIWDPLRVTAVQLHIASKLYGDAGEKNKNRPRPTFRGAWGMCLTAWARWIIWWRRMGPVLRPGYWWPGQWNTKSIDLLDDFWNHRDEEVAELTQWLSEPQDRVMLLTGPRGNGQGELVRHLITSGAVFVDVGAMLDQSSDDNFFLRRLCYAFGYKPMPLAERHLSALLAMTLPGSGKLDRGGEVESTVHRVLTCVTQALVDWRARRCGDRQHHGPDAESPLFVIEGFKAENKDRHQGFFDQLVGWADYVTDTQLARVLFIADSSFAEPAMLGALKGRAEKIEVLQLRDAPIACVSALLHRQLDVDASASLTQEELEAVGGRFRDVAALVAHVKQGDPPHAAVLRLIEATAMTVRTLLATGQPGAVWTRTQLWRAVRLVAASGRDGRVPYDVFVWSVFRGDEAALRSMLQSNLISVSGPMAVAARGVEGEVDEGRERIVSPGSPLIAEVCRRLVRQVGMAAVFDLEVAKEDIKREQVSLDHYEAQLVRLQEVDDVYREKGRSLSDKNEALVARKEQLLTLIQEQHKKLEKFHRHRRDAQAVLALRREVASEAVLSTVPAVAPSSAASVEPSFLPPASAPSDRGLAACILGRLGLA